MKKKKYQQGGPITPNYQTLGNIRFDSNISRPGPDGQMVVKDINTGKDFGIIRNDDGSYRYYSPRKKLQDNVEFHEINPLARTLLNEASPESVKYLDMAIPYLKQLSELSKNRVGGKMSAEEEQLRKSLADKITPVGYNPTGALEGVVTGTKSEYQFGRDEYLKEYLGLPSKMQESSYTIDNNKRYLKPYAPQFGDRGDTTNVYTNNALYERYRDLSIATEEKQGDKIQKGKSGSNIVINGGNYLNALGQYTMGRGVDDKGSYISVYDKWDLDPTRDMPKALKELSGLPDINNYNNPFEIYDRKYLSELSAEGRDSVYAKDKELGILPMDKRTKHSTGGQLNQMKKKKYASGGSMDPSMLLSILGPALGAVNPVLGASTQLMQQYINKQKQDAVVVSATPGNYDLGGPLYPMAQDSLQPMRYSIESTATNVGYNPLLVPIATGLTREEKWRDSRAKVYGKEVPYTRTTVPATGESNSKSKSKDRMRYAYGGPIERDNTHVSPKATANRVLQKLGDIRFYSDETRTAPEGYLIAKDVNSNKDFGVLRNQDGTYRFYDPNKDRLIANSNSESKNFYKDYLNSAFYKSAYSGFSDTASVIESYKIPVKGWSKEKSEEQKQIALQNLADFQIMKNEQLNALQNVKIYSAIDKRNGSHYNSFLEAPPSNVPGNITIDPTQYEKFGDFDSITAHELSHLKDKQQTQLKNSLQFANFGGDYESRFQDASKSQNFHDQSSEEYKADLNAARFLLKREGVYDFTKSPYPNMPEYIPDEDLDRMLKSMKEHPKLKVNGIIKRLLYLSKDDAALKEALRSYTDNFNPSTTMNAATGGKLKALNNYADGGQMDTQLSNESFQVKGNPNVTDGNYYPEYNANLDHNEVVKDQFVFSDKLKNPRTGKSFAAEAKVIETSIGRSQKALKINPNDQLAKNTIKFNEQRSQALASAQESLAQLKGLRSKDNVQNYAVGGVMGDPPYTIKADAQNDYFNPIDATTGRGRNPTSANTYTGFLPEKNQTLIDIGRDGMFYDPYRKEFAIRNSRGEYVPVEPTPGQFVQDAQGNIIDKKTNKSFAPQNQAAYDRAPKLLENRTTGADVSADYNSFKSSTPSAYKSSALPSAQNIQNNELPAGVTPQTHTLTPTGWVRNELLNTYNSLDVVPGSNRKQNSIPQKVSASSGAPFSPNGSAYMNLLVSGDTSKYSVNPLQPLNMLNRNTEYDDPTNPGQTITGPSDVTPQVQSLTERGLPQPPKIDTSQVLTPNGALRQTGNSRSSWTTGDYLQAAKVLSGFGQLIGGSEREKPNYDSTQITQSVYDPRQALNAKQRTYKDALAGYDSPSINNSRAYANALYANKLGQNDQTISQYQQMNQQARQQYEQRTADQRRYNVGQTTYTNDINANNRASYKEAVDTAFTGLSNFGVGLNQKKQGTDTLNLLKTMYPDVYANILKSIK